MLQIGMKVFKTKSETDPKTEQVATAKNGRHSKNLAQKPQPQRDSLKIVNEKTTPSDQVSVKIKQNLNIHARTYSVDYV